MTIDNQTQGYIIRRTAHYFAPAPDRVNYVMGATSGYPDISMFSNRADAQKWIDYADSRIYVDSDGEYSRPSYDIRPATKDNMRVARRQSHIDGYSQ